MKYSIIHSDKNTSARSGVIKTEHGNIQTPVFMPVGTVGAVKTFSPHELEGLGSDIILGNTSYENNNIFIDKINIALSFKEMVKLLNAKVNNHKTPKVT